MEMRPRNNFKSSASYRTLTFSLFSNNFVFLWKTRANASFIHYFAPFMQKMLICWSQNSLIRFHKLHLWRIHFVISLKRTEKVLRTTRTATGLAFKYSIYVDVACGNPEVRKSIHIQIVKLSNTWHLLKNEMVETFDIKVLTCRLKVTRTLFERHKIESLQTFHNTGLA